MSQLAEAGIVNSYPDGTFKGQNNIIRYEMAQMIAKAMANQDRANAEQQAMINRLADELSNELNNLGVRVARLQFNAKVNDRTDVVIRTTTGNMELGDAFQPASSHPSIKDKPSNIHIDRAYVNHKFGERVSVKAGRF